MRTFINLIEDYTEYKNSRWVHYTDYEMLKFNPKQFHMDPMGIYFFPESHVPTASMWHNKKYKIVVTLKPNARVLDLPQISDDELEHMVSAMGATEDFDDYINRYPPEDHAKKVRMAWEQMRNQFRQQAKWNNIVRNMGYDAIFDDAGIIHNAEPIQLVLLNPRAIATITREAPKRKVFDKMNHVLDELAAIGEKFGEVSIERPMKKRERYSNETALVSRLEIKRSEDNFANFNIRFEDGRIHVHLSWSKPHLDYGVGATFEVAPNKWQFDGLKSVEKDLKRIFQPEMALSPQE